jgi:hypothetical protein
MSHRVTVRTRIGHKQRRPFAYFCVRGYPETEYNPNTRFGRMYHTWSRSRDAAVADPDLSACPATLDMVTMTHDEFEEVKKNRIRAENYRKVCSVLFRSWAEIPIEIRRRLLHEVRSLPDYYDDDWHAALPRRH